MKEIKLEIFDGACECVSFSGTSEDGIRFDFGEGVSGYLSVGEITKRVENGVCIFDTRPLADGEYEASLVLGRAVIKLPKFKKTARKIKLSDCSEEYIRAASVRERRLARRVNSLETRICELEEKILGARLLNFK